jgi:hypothetical protein
MRGVGFCPYAPSLGYLHALSQTDPQKLPQKQLFIAWYAAFSAHGSER